VSLAFALVVAAVTGAVALSYEVLWFRVYSFASGGSPQAFGFLLGFYLAGLAVGAQFGGMSTSRTVSSANRRTESLSLLLFGASLGGYAVIPSAVFLVSNSRPGTWFIPVGVAAGLFGAVLPILADLSVRVDGLAGARVSYIYLANVVGSAAGTMTTGYWFLDIWTTKQLAAGLLAVGVAVSGCVLIRVSTSRSAWLRFAVVAGSVVPIAFVHPYIFDRLYERLLFKDPGNADRFVDLVENRQGVIAVTPSLRVYGGGAYDGVISTDLIHDPNMIIRAFEGVALNPHPRNVLMIGLSTGAWAQVIGSSEEVEHLTVVEINPGYLSIIAKHPEVRSVLSNPKITIVIDDGRRWLVHHSDTFDLIVANTTEHWRANTTNLLSREYVELIRRHLRPGGIYHFNTTDSQDAYKTAFVAFPYGMRFVNFASVSDSPFRLDSARWQRMLSRYRISGDPVLDLSDPAEQSRVTAVLALPGSLDLLPIRMGLESRERMLARLGKASVVTDDNMLPEWRSLLLGQ
jgi:spermidine synthase